MKAKIHAVEIHTGDYAKEYLEGKNISPHLAIYQKTKEWCEKLNIGHHAGHGLTDESVAPLIESIYLRNIILVTGLFLKACLKECKAQSFND